ncbi:MAG: NAD(P)/FAD-dependent oxidoreductase [Streptomycetales bacterium]
MEPVRTDLLLVGAGPVGLYGAYYAGFRGLRTVIVDALPQVGGQITAMYPEKLIHDVAGFPAVRGRDLVSALADQAGRFSPTYLLGDTVAALGYVDGLPVLRTQGDRAIHAGAVIVTGGIGQFRPRRLPAGCGYEGRGLVYFVPRPEDHSGQDVVVVGGGDSALDWVQALHPIARSVTLVHRRDRFRGHAHSVQQLMASPVRVLTSSEIARIHGERRVEAVDVIQRPSGTVSTVRAQAVVAALGFLADLGPLESWGLETEARQLRVSTTMATNLPRVYAAGDIATYPGKVRLISVGFGEVATAVNNAAAAIDPSLDVFPGHSTDAA